MFKSERQQAWSSHLVICFNLINKSLWNGNLVKILHDTSADKIAIPTTAAASIKKKRLIHFHQKQYALFVNLTVVWNVWRFFSFCYYSSMQDCRYLKQGECYTNRTDVESSSCDQNNTRHYIDSLHCYFNPDDDLAASSCPPQHYYRQCVCYTDKSPTMTVETCDNIKGYWMNTESTCYYRNLTCSGYWADGQCFSQVCFSPLRGPTGHAI